MSSHASKEPKIKSYQEQEVQSEQRAEEILNQLKLKLYNINEWKNFFNNPAPEFVLMDRNLKVKKEIPEAGDYIRIDLPGPGTIAGQGFDWVIINEVFENNLELEGSKEFRLKVNPAKNPENNEEETAHFYTGSSSSEFCVGRKGSLIYTWVKAIGEEPNVKEAKNWLDKLRNAVVGFSARTGLSELKWEQFTASMLKF